MPRMRTVTATFLLSSGDGASDVRRFRWISVDPTDLGKDSEDGSDHHSSDTERIDSRGGISDVEDEGRATLGAASSSSCCPC